MEVVEEFCIVFLDESKVVIASNMDGIHIDIDEHINLGLKMEKIVNEIIK